MLADKFRTELSWFPADCLHRTDFHCDSIEIPIWDSRVPSDTQMFQHTAKCNLRCVTIRWRAEKFYLRTVIVTAAVYRGFGRELHSEELTHFLNLPAPGRRQTLYIHLRVSRVLCF